MTLKEIAEFSSALLTPLIAILTWRVYRQQIRVEEQKLKLEERKFKHDTYEKRLAIFYSATRLLGHQLRKGDCDFEELAKFLVDTNQSRFLLGKDIYDYLILIYQNGARLHGLCEDLREADSPPEKRQRVIDEKHKLILWFSEQLEVVPEKFSKYLSLDG